MNLRTILIVLGLLLLVNTTSFTSLATTDDLNNQDSKIDKILVKKGKRVMALLKNGKVYRKYRIALGAKPKGHKFQIGDNRTPEGSYIIDYRNPQSGHFLSLHISYPNQQDQFRALQKGVSPGGNIMIHGFPNGLNAEYKRHYRKNWTEGCIAVTNREMEEIWELVPDGTPIEIKP